MYTNRIACLCYQQCFYLNTVTQVSISPSMPKLIIVTQNPFWNIPTLSSSSCLYYTTNPHMNIMLQITHRIRGASTREGFCSFSFNHDCFPMSHGHVDQQYKSTKCYTESFTSNSYFPLEAQRFSCTEIFLCVVLFECCISMFKTRMHTFQYILNVLLEHIELLTLVSVL